MLQLTVSADLPVIIQRGASELGTDAQRFILWSNIRFLAAFWMISSKATLRFSVLYAPPVEEKHRF